MDLLPGLSAAFHQEHNPNPGQLAAPSALLVDVGAHQGDFAARMLRLFTDLDGRRQLGAAHSDVAAMLGRSTRHREAVALLAFEPDPRTFSKLAARQHAQGWDALGFCALQAALGDGESRQTTFYSIDTDEESEMSTLEQAHFDGYRLATKEHQAVEVEVASLDAWLLDRHSPPESACSSCPILCSREAPLLVPRGQASDGAAGKAEEVFLLKVDVQGHDDRVLRGASRLLEDRLVRFLLFEYEYAGRA
eukprot:gnl/TRDRNA2_/TRDRNA2_171334_c0_seq1.p1 gnl/TRDRNA2_/TRDRNA2_171334_c0~~gnl/TRDRNA2_/TRDRNA2_171334_c0_seq1.p1  ORF type:complete len:267 (-),score=40.59 gnl/TRDRNA2_/TRDRNA2_171334_c0_seq1:5-751(-)